MINDNHTLLETERKWNRSLVFENEKRKSELCKAKDFLTDWYRRWCKEIDELPRFHRKQWEFAYVMQSLWERGCIAKGKKGLVFAVGSEPLPSVFAKYGCEILATDIHPEKGLALGWDNKNQLCFGLESLNTHKLCDDKIFHQLVKYRPVDMNAIPPDLTGFDFNWSSCSFEHLGSIQKGMNFLKNQLATLKPGGWAVHTTEFNVSSDDRTQDNDENTVIFRKKDIDKIVRELKDMGCHVEELDYSMGGLPEDFHVDIFPYKQDIHLKLQLNEYVATSIGLIIQKPFRDQKKKKLFFRFLGK
jgi:hypothetical protein